MSADRRMSRRWALRMSNEDAFRLFQEGILTDFSLQSDRPFATMDLEFVATWEAVYVSRPSERIVVGDEVVGYLPREADHAPDGWVARPMEWLVNGGSLDPAHLDRFLDACAPAEAVFGVRAWRDNLEKRS